MPGSLYIGGDMWSMKLFRLISIIVITSLVAACTPEDQSPLMSLLPRIFYNLSVRLQAWTLPHQTATFNKEPWTTLNREQVLIKKQLLVDFHYSF